MIGSIIVVIIIIIGAIYFFANRTQTPIGPNNQTPASESGPLDANQSALNSNDDLSAIESDLNVVSQEADVEVNAIERGLEQ